MVAASFSRRSSKTFAPRSSLAYASRLLYSSAFVDSSSLSLSLSASRFARTIGLIIVFHRSPLSDVSTFRRRAFSPSAPGSAAGSVMMVSYGLAVDYLRFSKAFRMSDSGVSSVNHDDDDTFGLLASGNCRYPSADSHSAIDTREPHSRSLPHREGSGLQVPRPSGSLWQIIRSMAFQRRAEMVRQCAFMQWCRALGLWAIIPRSKTW